MSSWQIFVAAMLALVVMLMVESCKPEDELPPEIEVQFPSAGANYQIPDTVIVGMIVTDEADLTNLEVKVIGPNNILASSVASIDPNGNRFEGSLSVELLDKYLPSGEYTIHIRARDGTNESFRFIEVQIAEVPKLRKALYAVTGIGTTSSVYKVDSSGSSLIQNLSQDPGFLCVDNRNDNCKVAGINGSDVIAVDLESGTEIWSSSAFQQPPQPTYLSMICDDGDTYVSLYDHQFRGLNETGVLIMDESTSSVFRPGELHATDDQLLVEQNEVGIFRNWIFRYFKDNGFQTNMLEVPIDVASICPFDEHRVMIFGNDETGQGRVLLFNWDENSFWEPRQLPEGSVSNAVETVDRNYAIIHEDGLLHYTYQPNFLNTLQTDLSFGRVRYDEDNGVILVASGSDIQEFDIAGNLVSSFQLPSAVVDFDIHYTK